MAGNRPAEGSSPGLLHIETEAQALASRLPELLVEARRVSMTIAHGIHGRRRPGPGDTFWQFRHYQSNDPKAMIDWRRSASSEHLFVREREWEAAHTVWLWADISPSMNFHSHLSRVTKRDRALVLLFAVADLLVSGGERVGLLGLLPPTVQRRAGELIAERLLQHVETPAARDSLPPEATVTRFSECVLLGDLLDPVEGLGRRVQALASQGVRGHIVQVLDPAEETLPYQGRTEFADIEGSDRLIANRAEALRSAYQDRLAAHRDAIQLMAQRLEWSFLVHRTDQPPERALLALHGRISGEADSHLHNGPGGLPLAGGRVDRGSTP